MHQVFLLSENAPEIVFLIGRPVDGSFQTRLEFLLDIRWKRDLSKHYRVGHSRCASRLPTVVPPHVYSTLSNWACISSFFRFIFTCRSWVSEVCGWICNVAAPSPQWIAWCITGKLESLFHFWCSFQLCLPAACFPCVLDPTLPPAQPSSLSSVSSPVLTCVYCPAPTFDITRCCFMRVETSGPSPPAQLSWLLSVTAQLVTCSVSETLCFLESGCSHLSTEAT